MKLKISLIVIVAALVTMGLSGAAFAFHNGGVAACESCHTMHNSKDGAVMSKSTDTTIGRTNNLVIGQAGDWLLQGTDQSSTCLNCHGANKVSASSYTILSLAQAIPTQRTPGGDFAWVLKKGAKKGHNVVAIDYGLVADSGAAPGGTYPAANLHCSSCHDPHGKYRKLADGTFATTGAVIAGSGSYGDDPVGTEAVGAYRLLGGNLYIPKSMVGVAGAVTFDEDPMSAAAPSSYNNWNLATGETNTETIVNYGDGTVGMWCKQCHPKMHETAGTAVNVHPNDVNLGDLATIYNGYKGSAGIAGTTGNLQGFTSLIPVAYDNIKTNSQLKNHFVQNGNISTNDRVMCLSCHRAHASGFDYMLRFPIAEVMTVDNGGVSSYMTGTDPAVSTVSGLSAAELQAALYDRPATHFPVEQRTLCNKCHAKD